MRRDGGDVSPPILESGAFVPPKIISWRRKIFYFEIFNLHAFILKAQHSVASSPRPLTAQNVWERESAGHRSEVQLEREQQLSLKGRSDQTR